MSLQIMLLYCKLIFCVAASEILGGGDSLQILTVVVAMLTKQSD